MHLRRRGLLACAGTTLLPMGAGAQGDWPNRPIRLVVPFAAGGAADSAARAITPVMTQRLGQSIVVENRTGAGGSVGGGAVAASAPDGYTLLWDASSHLVNPALMKGLPFDYASFVPVSLVVTFPGVLAVKQDFPAKTLAEFIALAKAKPGSISVGTQGNATAGHVGLLQFCKRAGIEVIHAPYRGGADAARDLAAGAIDAVFITTVSAGPIVDSGRARFLAVATLQRVPSRPDVPTLAESGFPGFDSNEWAALFGPHGMPAPIVAKLHEALTAALADDGVKQRLAQIGAVPVGSAPADFARFVKDGREQMAVLVREAGIRLD
ncbi:Bug family tripartite tricarboxylate transporter substrate binding protein [Paracraurococcus lichenis]|uniref:Tripartite tricarboxylate transporter substrate-binding protein n=1 Tax=Paracraurococcus lichenis TaxID=3064888 RepID=A0ABT9E1L3_9PROT|nr:tripartite tricarboxylate transporter substrate-binding protein [Paracraurococcus sp. LOR1-02]MDO9710000.1 tripartite tricarboxylate transporter substrate-binding protein [Paracraurococcus sp. LOR1-02]